MFLRAALVAFAALQLPYFAFATLIQLDDLDARITWSPQAKQPSAACREKPNNNVCTGFWWSDTANNYHAGGSAQTWGPDTSMSFTFNGSSFMIFGPKLAAGAGGVVTVDGRDAGTFSTTAEGVLEALPQQLLFMQGDLDATQQHTVVVSYDKRTFGSTGANRRWLGIDYVLVDERVQGRSQSGSPAHDSTASKMAGVTLGLVIALPLLGGLTIGLAIILVIVLRRRRVNPLSHPHPPPPPSGKSDISESRRPSATTESSYLPRVPSTIQTQFVHVLPPPMSSTHSPSEVASTHFGASTQYGSSIHYGVSEPVPYLLNPKAVVESVGVTRPSEKAAVLGLQPPLYQRVQEKD